MTLSNFDTVNLGDIILWDDKYDWFSARLLQFLARCSDKIFGELQSQFPEETGLVAEWKKNNTIGLYTAYGEEFHMDNLLLKADSENLNKLVNSSSYFEERLVRLKEWAQ